MREAVILAYDLEETPYALYNDKPRIAKVLSPCSSVAKIPYGSKGFAFGYS